MKPGFQPAVLFATVLIGAIASMTGCATTGMDRATKTTNSMQKVESDYRQASGQIDATRATLEDLVKPEQTDTKKAYEAYADNVGKMEKIGTELMKHSEKMRTRGNDYFVEWESSYTNPEIRELSERRRIEIKENYARIPEASVGVKGALKSYLTDIREIQRYLSNDLTAEGVEAIRPVAANAVTDGDNLQVTVKHVLTAIDRVKDDMVQGGMNKESAADSNQK